MTLTVEDIRWRLAQLASLPYQERWVVGGTADEYILADELVENVDGLRFRVSRPENQAVITDAQKVALNDLFAYLDANAGKALDADTPEAMALLINESPIWTALRAKAAGALALFGLSIDDLTVEEIERMSEG